MTHYLHLLFNFLNLYLDNYIHVYNASWLLSPHPLLSSYNPYQFFLLFTSPFPTFMLLFCDPLNSLYDHGFGTIHSRQLGSSVAI